MRYDQEYALGRAAYAEGEPRRMNPEPWGTPGWHSWQAGWDAAQREDDDAIETSHALD